MNSGNGELMVGLLWHSIRHHNLGSGALAISHLTMLNSAAKQAQQPLAYRLFCFNGPNWYPPAGIKFDEVIIKGRKDLIPGTRLWRGIFGCDVILDIGEGDQFSDTYGGKPFFWFSLVRILVLLQRKPLILSPQTIGPFKRPWARWLAAQWASRCKQIFTRDTQSLSRLNEMGLVKNVEATADVAFRLPFERSQHESDQQIRFGLNVSGLLYSQDLTRRFGFDLKVDYPSLIHRIIETLTQRLDVSLIFVPHVIGNVPDDDSSICERLAGQFNVQVAPRFASPVDAKSFISSLDILAGSRLHATIAAISCGVPVVPLAYSRKFRGLFESLNYPLVLDLMSQDADSVVSSVCGAVDRIAELRAAAVRTNALAQSKLDRYQEYLVQLMSSFSKNSSGVNPNQGQ